MTRKVLLFLIGVVSLILIWTIWWQHREVAGLQAEISRVTEERNEAVAQAAAQGKIISGLENSLNEKNAQASAPKLPSPKDEPIENALDLWLGKIRRLNAYLEKHPERQVPQMNFLTAADWLDATKETKLDSEAEIRKALGRLRGMARQKVAGAIAKALEQAMEATDGRAPTDVQLIVPYLPAGFDSTILKQLTLNPSGEIEGLRLMDGKSHFFLVDTPVDDLWDATLFYDKNGNWGMHSGTPSGEIDVANAIAQFTKMSGALPTNTAQLKSYPGINSISPASLEEMFRALTTKPD